MATARRRAAWERTSHLMALVANAFRDPRRRALKPADFNPFAPRRPPPTLDADELAAMFAGQLVPRTEKTR